MRVEFLHRTAPSRDGARYSRVEVSVDGARVGYIEGLDETYVIHLPSGGEVGPYHSLDEAKSAVRIGLRGGALKRGRH